MAEEEDTGAPSARPEIPTGRVKRIVKLDKEINKVTSEALFLVSSSTELFLRFLAERSAEVAAERKRKTVKLDHLRTAVKRHQPTSDFLLDSLPSPAPTAPSAGEKEKACSRNVANKPAPAGTRRIDYFFTKPGSETPVQIDDS